jgi:ubiquinol-cytochrome c reductase cytochrome c1 subunit
MNYTKYFTGYQIAMSSPLVSEGQVTYADGTKATVDQMAHDVTMFLAWSAEPEMEDRKRTGIQELFFLAVLSVLFCLSKRKLWGGAK